MASEGDEMVRIFVFLEATTTLAGFDFAGMDTSVIPGDDSYQHAAGTRLKSTPISADKSNYGSSSVFADLSQRRVRDVLDRVRVW
jgi:putative endopeptidase